MTEISADENRLKKVRFTRIFWQIVRGIVVIVAAWGFVAFLSFEVYGAQLGFTAFAVSMIATLALRVMPFEPATPSLPVEGEIAKKRYGLRTRLPECSLLAYGVIFSVGSNWVCVFLWFSRRYDFFSTTVIGVTVLIMALYSAIALVVTHLTTRNWRTLVLLFAFAPGVLAGIVLRL